MRYDAIGRTYTATRRTEPRVAARIDAQLGDAKRVLNVGAGSGSYEPPDRDVVAVEPSRTMLAQRAPGGAPAVQAAAEALPFADDTFDAAMAIFTVHHWTDADGGLRELARVARRHVFVTFDGMAEQFWLVSDYFPVVATFESDDGPHTPAHIATILDVKRVDVLPVPADCIDGFFACYWNRPEAYLDPLVQAGISGLARLDEATRTLGIEKLRDDLASGAWDERHGHLRTLDEIDVGYRLVTAYPG
jgi:ubiquinone/menaquinone biosynthesis C-methylase UbiE